MTASFMLTFSLVHADVESLVKTTTPCALSTSGSNSSTAVSCGLKTNHEIFQNNRKERLSENKKNRMTESWNLAEFRMSLSGTLRDEKKSHSGSNEAFKEAVEYQKSLRETLSGKTLENKLAMRNLLEDAQKAKITAKLQWKPELLTKRLEVYEKNKSLREENAANLLANLLERSELRSADVDAFIARVHDKIITMSKESKDALQKKIEERIQKIQSAQWITQAVKDEIIKKLTHLSLEITASTQVK